MGTKRGGHLLGKLEIILENEDKERLNYNISSLFQGVLMEAIDIEYAESLHNTGLKPYSQYLEFENNLLKWTIHTLTEEAKNQIINPLLNNLQEVNLKHKNLRLKVLEKKVSIKTYEQLLNEKYFSQGNPYIDIDFITPTAFKSKGKYVFYPNLRLVFQSLMNKFDKSSVNSSIYSQEVLEHLVSKSDIRRYRLKSRVFHMEGIIIPSFTGRITIKIGGPQAMVNLANLLFAYGEYSGAGIKSAIGMGGLRTKVKGAQNE
ncbi:MAG: CRISPR-associated endoribonuclease Cas6 [Tissierellia bacterium]|nr:CRISPR-associated endoribonuclease Cas6 [Tissierellia bacterium]